MAKTIFHSSDQSNFILNMDLGKYRAFCAKMALAVLWMTAGSQLIFQLTYSVNGRLSEMMGEGGFSGVLALILIMLRSVATFFSIGGVLAIITAIIGMVRVQFTRSTAAPYLLLLGSLLWGVISMFHAFDMDYALFGQDGRDEGWISLLMYAALFYLGTMLRRKENIQKFLSGILIFGIVQNVWAILQAQPFFDFPNTYADIEPLLFVNLRLPSGLTDSPITFAMLLAMLLALSVPAALCAEHKQTRILAAVCACLSMLTVFKTQTFAGLIAGCGALLLTAAFCIAKRKTAGKMKCVLPAAVLAAAVCSGLWTYAAPSINNVRHLVTDTTPENGFAFYDGGILWDDSFYRLSTSGLYSAADADFNIHDASAAISYCWSEGIRVIKKYPVLGTGPDNFAFTQLHTSLVLQANVNSVDRPYNDFLFIAATRGILSMVLHIALLIVCAVLAWKHRKAAYGWMLAAAGGAVLLYSLTALVGISVLTVAPLFWVLLGILAGEPIADAPPKQPRGKQRNH